MLDRRPDRVGRTRCAFVLPQLRIELIELPHLAIGAPTQIAVAGVPQIGLGDRLEATRRVEARGQFVGERLVVNKAVGAGRADGLFVEALGIELAAFEARDLGADQGGTVFEILWAIRRPELEFPVEGGQCVDMLPPIGRRRVAGGGVGQRAVELIFGLFEVGWRCPQKLLRPRRGRDGRRIIAGKEARLQLADPVPALDKGQIRIF